MADRYFIIVPHVPTVGERVSLEGPEAHHLLHVMRRKAGDVVRLFDGVGHEFDARIERTNRADVQLSLLSVEAVDREWPFALTLGVGLPKGDRQRVLIEHAVELGVARVVPLITKHGDIVPNESALARLRRSVIEASKQSGRTRLMEVTEPQRWDAFIAGSKEDVVRLVAHPERGVADGDTGRDWGPGVDLSQTAGWPSATLAIGPVGGLADNEVEDALAAGWRRLDLGPRLLRVETAVALAVAEVLVARRHVAK